MTTIDIYTGKEFHPAQRAIYDHPARFKIVCCGRRWGKTLFLINLAVITASGSKQVGVFAPTFKHAADIWRELKKILPGAIKDKSEQMHRLDLIGGGAIEVWSAETDNAALGRSYDLALFDEAAVGDFMTLWDRNIRPTLTDRRGKAVIASTPRGYNWFHGLWQRGKDKLRFPSWESWQLPSSTNPFFPPEELEEERLTKSEILFAQEYLAEFMSDATVVFRNLENCQKAAAQERAIPGHAYVIGGDLARINDLSVFTVIDLTTRPKQIVHIDASQGAAFELQMDRLAFLCERFRPMVVMLEDNANLQMIETTQRLGLPVQAFHTTNITKNLAVDKLAMAFEREDLWIPADPILVGQLRAYQPKRTPSGLVKYGAPEGQYDDYVSSLMIANWAAAEDLQGEAAYIRFG